MDLLFPENGPRLTVLSETLWAALEDVVAPEVRRRRQGLRVLAGLPVEARSPLVAYVLVTRLTEPEMKSRAEVVRLLAQWLRHAPEETRATLRYHLRQVRRRPIFALLELAGARPALDDAVEALLAASAFAARHLAQILEDRAMPLPVRRQAAEYLARLGFREALPVVERVLRRLEGRIEGQRRLPFAPEDHLQEIRLLESVRRAWLALQAP